MTKRRAALSYELALTKIAGLVGWERCAEVLDQSERTVRNWSDPDARAGIRMDAAEILDLEFQACGGSGSPLLECLALRQKSAAAQMWGSSEAITVAAAKSAKEGGEAIAAAIAAARPDADDTDYAIAERELEEGIAADTETLRAIRERRATERDLEKGEQ